MKRLFDVIVALMGLFFFVFPLLVLILFIRLKLGRPIFFSQTRPGFNGKPFRMMKFRSMTDERDSRGVLLPDSQRLTPFGRFLRSTSLDEIPGLLNVLRGDMSLVGPRPLAVEYLTLYSAEQARRHNVRPGITGWAQVNGRNAITWTKKFELDVWYVDNHNFWLDLKILVLTFFKVIRRSDVKSDGQAEVQSFNGSN